ncbi:MAG: hypothetical protein FWH26_11255 [Oscillospiraceae bacterium]|nr:hypothetical protein [Oscillospiraceae bacterium]
MDSAAVKRIQTMLPHLDEKQKRLFLAAEVESMGRGGLRDIHELTGVSKTTIIRGKRELSEGSSIGGRIRNVGGGRNPITEKYSNIEEKIEEILSEETAANARDKLSHVGSLRSK